MRIDGLASARPVGASLARQAVSSVADPAERPAPFGVTIDRAPVGIAHFDASGRFLFANPTLCTLFGLTRDRLLAKTFQELSFPDELRRCLALTAQLIKGEIPKYTNEKRFKRPDGSFIYARVIVTAVRDDANRFDFFLGIVEDLSDQWAAEQGRRDAEQRLDLALKASGTGIYRYDFQRQALDWANNLTALFGFPADEPLGTFERLTSVIHQDDLPGVLERYEKCLTEGADFDHEFRVVLPDGSIRWLCDRAKASRGEDGTPRYLTGACTDITAVRQAHEERERLLDAERRARLDAERAARMRDEVLAVVAHDLRNPAHTIVLGAAVLDALSPTAVDDRRKQLDIIKRSATTMDHLIRDLLDVAQIQMGTLAIRESAVSIDTLLDEISATFAPKASQANVHFECAKAADLPRIWADHGRVVQVLGNLITNALKFTDAGGAVRVGARPVDRGVEFSVADSGHGISAEDLPRVFERFWQARRGTAHGAGLGLAIVRGIVDAHGGAIDVDSEVGKGTTFRATFRAHH